MTQDAGLSGLISWTRRVHICSGGIMMKSPSGNCAAQVEVFHRVTRWECRFFLALSRVRKVECALVLGGFLGAAPIYSNPVAGGRRHYPARLAGGGRL